jgi:hypothetical protein
VSAPVALRSHQEEAVAAVAHEFERGVRRTAIVHPTGLGKGHILSKLATDEVARGGRVLVLCHQQDVLDDITKRCALFAPQVPVGRVQAGRNEHRRPIVTAMIQTLGRESRRKDMELPTLVIVDECHRVGSKGYLETIRWARCYEPDGARLVGLTATFVRHDRFGLADVFESVAHRVELAWAVTNGPDGPCEPGADAWLKRPVGRVVVADHVDLAQAKVSTTAAGRDYQSGELGEMVSQDADRIVEAWLEHAAERKTMAFVPDVQSAFDLGAAFVAQGVACEVVVGTTPQPERREMYARLAAGSTRVIVNVFVLVEGFDEPSVNCILWARPTRLPGVYMQGVGRGLRRHAGLDDCLILDVVGASRHQRLVTLVDLVPSAEYDTAALDLLPCEQCGLPTTLKAAAELGVDEACRCGASESPGAGLGRRKLEGPATYEDLDLLFTASPFVWLATERRGTPFLPTGERMAVLWRNPDGTYRWGHIRMKGLVKDGVRMDDGLTLDEARRRAEAWALLQPEGKSYADRARGWRTGPASAKQQEKALSLGLSWDEIRGLDKAGLSDRINVRMATNMLDKRWKVTR